MFVAVCPRISCVCIVSARMSPLWGFWSLCGYIHQNGRSDDVCGYMSQSMRSPMFVHVSPRIWGLWCACYYKYQHVRCLSWVYARGISSPVCLCFCECGCEVSYLSVGVCLSVWGLWGLFGFASHGVRSLIWFGGYLLRYEVYVFLSLDVPGCEACGYLSLYIPGCEVSYLGVYRKCKVFDLFVVIWPWVWGLWSVHGVNSCKQSSNVKLLGVTSYDAWCDVFDLFEGAWPTVWSIWSIPCVFPNVWGLSPGWGYMSHGVRPLIYLQVYSQERCSLLSFERWGPIWE